MRLQLREAILAMKSKYTYWDNSKPTFIAGRGWVGQVAFECTADGILAADKLFAEADIKFSVKKSGKATDLMTIVSSKAGAGTLGFIGCSSEVCEQMGEEEVTLKPAPIAIDTVMAWSIIALHATYTSEAKHLAKYADQVELGYAKTAQNKADAFSELAKLIAKSG